MTHHYHKFPIVCVLARETRVTRYRSDTKSASKLSTDEPVKQYLKLTEVQLMSVGSAFIFQSRMSIISLIKILKTYKRPD